MNLREERLNSKIIFDGKMIKLRYDSVRLPNGKDATREVVEHPGAVAIVPRTDDGKFILVRQYRYAVGQELLEIPAGKLNSGEVPEIAAARELEEETGYIAKKLYKLTAVYTTPGFTNELMYLYLADQLQFSQQKLDEDEFINVETYSPSEVKALITKGLIQDAKTMVGLLLAGI